MSSAQSGASSVGPYETLGGVGPPLISRCWPGLAPSLMPWRSPEDHKAVPLQKRVMGYAASQSRPWNLSGNPGPAPPELEPALTPPPRAALAMKEDGKRWNSHTLRVPALHREAECDTTGNIGHQHSVHTWNATFVQGSVARRSQLPRFGDHVLRAD